MAINKKLIHFNTFENFNSKKLSANAENTQYTLGVNGEIQTGSPDILYQSIVYIKDTKQQWTHGTLYKTMNWSVLELTTFIIGNITYEVEKGMTWEEWVNSEYNTLNFYENSISKQIKKITSNVCYANNEFVYSNQQIIESYSYKLVAESAGDETPDL